MKNNKKQQFHTAAFLFQSFEKGVGKNFSKFFPA